MSHLFNPLATTDQLQKTTSLHLLPVELQDSIRFYTARLTQAAGVLLRLPLNVSAQANVLLFRYWVINDFMQHEFSDVSAAITYMTAKLSASPRSLRSITNVYAYLLAEGFPTSNSSAGSDPESYYLSEDKYITFRNRILNIEGAVLNALGFNTRVALPHPLAITYLQSLDLFSSQVKDGMGKEVAQRMLEYLNTALLSPQMLYLTHQPCALATAAIYLAARDKGIKMPEVDWWEVFDCEREELGFLAVAMRSLEGLAERERERWGEVSMITRTNIKESLRTLGGDSMNGFEDSRETDEVAEMVKLMDERAEGQ